MENVLDKSLSPTTEMIQNLFEIENAMINTNHPDFVGAADAMLNLFEAQQDSAVEEDSSYKGSYVNNNSIAAPQTKTFSLLSGK
jgi:dynamin 1-like protein